MDSIVEGKGTKAVTLSNRITQAIELAVVVAEVRISRTYLVLMKTY